MVNNSIYHSAKKMYFESKKNTMIPYKFLDKCNVNI